MSESISNWKGKILKRTKLEEYNWRKNRKDHCLFFGLYRPRDWLKFLAHRGQRTVYWCGSDVLQVGILFRLFQKISARHICENEVEQGILRLLLQQEVEVQTIFLSDPDEFPISYKRSDTPHVWMHINANAGLESGFPTLLRIAPRCTDITFHVYGRLREPMILHNIVFHGWVPEDQFNEEIKNYQCGWRAHEFDGSSEVVMKSILMGQYPISRIRYYRIPTYESDWDLIAHFASLKYRFRSNPMNEYYRELFKLWKP